MSSQKKILASSFPNIEIEPFPLAHFVQKIHRLSSKIPLQIPGALKLVREKLNAEPDTEISLLCSKHFPGKDSTKLKAFIF